MSNVAMIREMESLLIGTGADIDRYADESFSDVIKPVGSFIGEIISRLFGENKQQGYNTPWPALNGKFWFRPGELTIWSGPSKEGKSLITGQCMTHIVESGGRAALASLELHPYETIGRMIGQFNGYDRPLLREDMVHSFSAMQQRLACTPKQATQTKRMLAPLAMFAQN
jgi:hypothetical protein